MEIRFQLWASCEYDMLTSDGDGNTLKVNIKCITTNKYTITISNGELNKSFKDFLFWIAMEYGDI